MKELSHTGGARVGIMNASYPLAKLYVEGGALHLNVLLLGKHRFQTDEITALRHVTTAIGVGKGIKIEHNHATYTKELIFWTMKDPVNILNEIAKSSLALPVGVIHKQPVTATVGGLFSEGNPFKVSYMIAAVLLTLLAFAPFLYSALSGGVPDMQQFVYRGVFVQGILICSLLGAIYSPAIREYVLKEGEEIARHKSGLLLFIGLTCFAMIILLIAGGLLSQLIEAVPAQ